MWEHKCSKETQLALYNKIQSDMVAEIKEIKEEQKITNYWIEVLKGMFADMRLNHEKDRQDMIELIKKDCKENYADKKDVENAQKDVNFLKKTLWGIVMTIITLTIVAILKDLYK